MAKRKMAQLDGSLLVARKGDAVPAGTPARIVEPTTEAVLLKGTKDTIAVTVRLDAERYRKLVSYGARFVPRRTNQETLITALDAYLAQVE